MKKIILFIFGIVCAALMVNAQEKNSIQPEEQNKEQKKMSWMR